MGETGILIREWLPIFLAGGSVAMFVIIKFNDMLHIQKKVDDLIKTIDKHCDKVDSAIERIAKIEGKCSANHS